MSSRKKIRIIAPPTEAIKLPKKPSTIGIPVSLTTQFPINPPMTPTTILPKNPNPSPPSSLLATYPLTAPKKIVRTIDQSIELKDQSIIKT